MAYEERLIALDEDFDTSGLDPSPDIGGLVRRDNWEFYRRTVETLGAIGDERAVDPIIESIAGMRYDPYYTRRRSWPSRP